MRVRRTASMEHSASRLCRASADLCNFEDSLKLHRQDACSPCFGTSRRLAGFTLIEIVIVMTILAVLAAATVPTFKGIQREREARAPIAELVSLAKEARLRAIKEKRPYQVVFTGTGFYATRYFDPYLTLASLTEFIEIADAAAQAGLEEEELAPDATGGENQAITAATTGTTPGDTPASSTAAAAETAQEAFIKAEWVERYLFPTGTSLSVQYWHEAVPTQVAGDVVRLWVFQPSGICDPLKLALSNGDASIAVEFSALTVDIVKETSRY
jgi:prepilin-type N-terminal cleavage/methylation domain-containing protein